MRPYNTAYSAAAEESSAQSDTDTEYPYGAATGTPAPSYYDYMAIASSAGDPASAGAGFAFPAASAFYAEYSDEALFSPTLERESLLSPRPSSYSTHAAAASYGSPGRYGAYPESPLAYTYEPVQAPVPARATSQAPPAAASAPGASFRGFQSSRGGQNPTVAGSIQPSIPTPYGVDVMPRSVVTQCSQESPRQYTYPMSGAAAGLSGSTARAATPTLEALGQSAVPRTHDVNTDDGGVVCLFPGCTSKPFRRKADLDRHYQHVHSDKTTARKTYPCDYPLCPRRNEPFGRLDHYRDHLRGYHNEDIGKRGGTITGGAGTARSGYGSRSGKDSREATPLTTTATTTADPSLAHRNVSASWWRCPKCLQRVSTKKNGWECPNDQVICQEGRREARIRLKAAAGRK